HATEVLSFPSGSPAALTLVMPKWIPGEHGPTGPITDLAGLRMEAGGAEIPWKRVETDMNAFEVALPSGAKELRVSLDLISAPPAEEGFTSGASTSAQVAVLSWNQVLLYPAGDSPRDVQVEPSLTLPAGWHAGSALHVASGTGDRLRYERVTLE